jgi:thermostable 8-oxoguanine DNA glycosylase
MVDPQFITKYDRTDADLEEFAAFSICVAGKNAKVIAGAVSRLKQELCYALHKQQYDNFRILIGMRAYNKLYTQGNLVQLMSSCGIGCANNRVRPCISLAKKILVNPQYLRECTVEDLESIWGIGSKTARFFILHSKANVRVAVLDVHILKWLREQGCDAPKTTPPKGSKKYKELENKFLEFADQMSIGPAVLDLKLWNQYSKNGLTYDKSKPNR